MDTLQIVLDFTYFTFFRFCNFSGIIAGSTIVSHRKKEPINQNTTLDVPLLNYCARVRGINHSRQVIKRFI